MDAPKRSKKKVKKNQQFEVKMPKGREAKKNNKTASPIDELSKNIEHQMTIVDPRAETEVQKILLPSMFFFKL